MKKLRTAAILTAAALALSMSGIFGLSASAQIDLENLPEPVSSGNEAKAFEETAPKVSFEVSKNYNTLYCELTWEPVDNAMFYEVYVRQEGEKEFSLAGTFFDESCDFSLYNGESAAVKVRAVTFTYDDEIVYSKFSTARRFTAPTVSKTVRNRYDGVYGGDGYSADHDLYEEAVDEVGEVGVPDYAPAAPVPAVSNSAFMPSPYDPDTEEYDTSPESVFRNTSTDPVSTFSADTDTASYANIRRFLRNGNDVPENAVRIEEMLNYFDYDYPEPAADGVPFSVYSEISDCPWNDEAKLMMIGLQGSKPDTAPASNLVFLVDVSGSMSSYDKMPLVVESLNILTSTLTEKDRISIVIYSGTEDIILAGARGDQTNTVATLTSLLEPYGSTNGESGINAAYTIAEKYFIEGGNNRIILCTDGDLNVGISSEEELTALIEKKRESGVYFSVLGFGTGNIKDNKMEALADNGNGSYYYIDSAKEAEKVLLEERDSTLYTIAKDVKIQVEFNPQQVKSYRLIGYDNRRLENSDFENDAKDAGEVGAGHSVTALYEIIPADGSEAGLKYTKKSDAAKSGEWAEVKLRYKEPEANGRSMQLSKTIGQDAYKTAASDWFKFASAVAEAGLILQNSEYKGSASMENAFVRALNSCGTDYYKREFAGLILRTADTDRIKFTSVEEKLPEKIKNTECTSTDKNGKVVKNKLEENTLPEDLIYERIYPVKFASGESPSDNFTVKSEYSFNDGSFTITRYSCPDGEYLTFDGKNYYAVV